MNFFCSQSTDQIFPLLSVGLTCCFFRFPTRTRFVHSTLMYMRACHFPFILNVVSPAIISFFGDMHRLQRSQPVSRVARRDRFIVPVKHV